MRPKVGAGDGCDVAVVAAYGDGEVAEVRGPVVGWVPGEDLDPMGCGLQYLDPRVRPPFADEMAGYVTSGEAEQPA